MCDIPSRRSQNGNYRFAPLKMGRTADRRQVTEMLVSAGFTSSREFRGPVELFVASVAEWDGDVVRLVMAA